MGDFNLSHRSTEDQTKIVKLCQEKKINVLHEITRPMSNNQLEYILIDESIIENYFVTSFNNFISDHKTIVARVGLNGNMLTHKIKERLTFDKELHLKAKEIAENISSPTLCSTQNKDQVNVEQKTRKKLDNAKRMKIMFSRKFHNPDSATCWLNSCLQLILTAMDYDEYTSSSTFNSELGKELLRLQNLSGNSTLDPTTVKDLIVTSEDTQIATRLSEISYRVIDPNYLENQSRQIRNLRLDLRNGQQCVRDFFLCLDENILSWPDVYSLFSFKLTHSSECTSCKHRNESETMQLYLEMPVPSNNSNLKASVEDFLNGGSTFENYCDKSCKAIREKIKRTKITTTDEVKFLIVILTRGIETEDGFHLVKNKIKSTDNITLK
jgi:hypothetical protein